MNLAKTIEGLPDSDIYINRGLDRLAVFPECLRTDDLKRLVTALESIEYELSHGDLIAGNVTRFSVKDALLKQVREALGK